MKIMLYSGEYLELIQGVLPLPSLCGMYQLMCYINDLLS